MTITMYNELVVWTQSAMQRYRIPQPLHQPEEYVNNAFINVGFSDVDVIKKNISIALGFTKLRDRQKWVLTSYPRMCKCCLVVQPSDTSFFLYYKYGGFGECLWYYGGFCKPCDRKRRNAHNRKYRSAQRKNLGDSYVKAMAAKSLKISSKDVTPEMIVKKRASIIASRAKKQRKIDKNETDISTKPHDSSRV